MRDVPAMPAPPPVFTPAVPVDAALFRKVAGSWTTGVAVITTVDPSGKFLGLTMSAVTSLSLNPMQFLICVDNRSDSLPAMMATRLFCINILNSDQAAISNGFAGKAQDKFAGVGYRVLDCGVPLLDGVVGWVACSVSAVLPGGDHAIVIGDVLEGGVPGGSPLLYSSGRYGALAPAG